MKTESVSTALLRITLPYRFGDGKTSIALVEQCPADIHSPFLNDDLDVSATADGRIHMVAIEDYLDFLEEQSLRLKGAIFHVGRCGSTLVANYLAHDPATNVLREPGILTRCHRQSNWLGTGVKSDKIARAVLSHLALYGGDHVSNVVKLTSWTTPHAAPLLRAWPDLPLALVVRKPDAVVASMMDRISPWGEVATEGMDMVDELIPGARELFRQRPVTMARFYAAAWTTAVEAVADMANLVSLDYDDLVYSPGAVVRGLAEHFGMRDDWVDLAVATESQNYAKAPKASSVLFDPDGRHQRPPLGPQSLLEIAEITEAAKATLAMIPAIGCSGPRHQQVQ